MFARLHEWFKNLLPPPYHLVTPATGTHLRRLMAGMMMWNPGAHKSSWRLPRRQALGTWVVELQVLYMTNWERWINSGRRNLADFGLA
jgi:hypothetical protein